MGCGWFKSFALHEVSTEIRVTLSLPEKKVRNEEIWASCEQLILKRENGLRYIRLDFKPKLSSTPVRNNANLSSNKELAENYDAANLRLDSM